VAGLIEGGYVEIKDGLRPGEIVVSDGLNKMQPGMPVNFCATQLPQLASAPGGRAGMGGGRGEGRGGRGGAPDGAVPGAPSGAAGRPGGQSRGGSLQGRPGGPGGRIAGASS
jgi:hypothetical protein